MNYELMVLTLLPKEADAKKLFAQITKLLKDSKAEKIKEDYWGKRDLAYKIKSSSAGYYTVFNFTMDKSQTVELSTQLRLNEDVARFLLSKLD